MADEQVLEAQATENQHFRSQSMLERESEGAQDYKIDENAFKEAQAKDLESKNSKMQQTGDGKQELEEKPAAQEQEKQIETKGGDEESILDSRPKVNRKSSDWDSLKTKHAEEVANLKRQIEESASDERIEELQKELDQYKELIKETSIEKDPEFRQKYDTEKNSYAKQVKAIIGKDADQIERILDLPSSDFRREKLGKLAEELSDSDKARLEIIMREIDGIDIRRQAEIDTKKATWERDQRSKLQHTERQRESVKSEIFTTLDRTIKEWKEEGDSGHFLFQDDGNKETQKAIIQAEKYAKNWLDSVANGTIKPSDLAKSALHLSAIPRFNQFVTSVMEERDQLKAKLEKIHKSRPGDGSKVVSESGSKEFKSHKDDGYSDHFRSTIEAAQRTN